VRVSYNQGVSWSWLTDNPLARFARRPPRANAPTFAVARWVFLRLAGLTYLIAFLSLGSQILGLIGSRGILPAQPLLDAASTQLGPARYWWLPTLCWFSASDAVLRGLCLAGAGVSALLLLDVAPALCALIAWALYLSLATVCREFLSYQWDALLLEMGFLAIFFSPLRLSPRLGGDAPERPLVRRLLWWLLFRLMVSSGVVKLASGDPTWRHLTALTYHYETQPLPTWIGWYAHQLPHAFHLLSCVLMVAIELAVPWLILGSSRVRTGACAALIGFQVLIAATGNYCFFNLITIALCLLLLDDAAWPRALRERFSRPIPAAASTSRWPRWVMGPVATVLLGVSTVQMGSLLGLQYLCPAPLVGLVVALQPWQVVNSYGLFAVMTTSRPEIVVEGSDDGTTWHAYAFPYKPGDLRRRPAFVAPHQPRLDWQMWFAALGTYREAPWFLRFCEQLLRGSPDVLALLADNPFPRHPPRYIRATRYDYHFTDLATKRAEGAWWRRSPKGLYCPVLSLRER